MLEVERLESGYGQSRVLFDISFAVRRGEVVTLLGRNGVGKTTTVRSIMGLLAVRAGIFPNLTVRENLVATAANRSGASALWTMERVFELFPGLAARRRMLGANLSGGEQQMLAIGRALMTNPKLLVLDEATEGLAPLVRAQIWSCLHGLKAGGLSILVIDKNVEALTRLADRHYIIEKGRIVWRGTSPELAADATLRRRFLGV